MVGREKKNSFVISTWNNIKIIQHISMYSFSFVYIIHTLPHHVHNSNDNRDSSFFFHLHCYVWLLLLFFFSYEISFLYDSIPLVMYIKSLISFVPTCFIWILRRYSFFLFLTFYIEYILSINRHKIYTCSNVLKWKSFWSRARNNW